MEDRTAYWEQGGGIALPRTLEDVQRIATRPDIGPAELVLVANGVLGLWDDDTALPTDEAREYARRLLVWAVDRLKALIAAGNPNPTDAVARITDAATEAGVPL